MYDKDIRAIVPHMSMSAGTMFACACKKIIMGKHSFLGPIDPQIWGIPAFDIVQEFNAAYQDIKENPDIFRYWEILLSKYPIAIYSRCEKSIELSEILLRKWLNENMLEDVPENSNIIDKITETLNENDESKTHSRHFDNQQCKDMGLKIVDLEADQELQEKVLSIHHCYMHLFNRGEYSKIIENHNGICVITRKEP